MSKTSILGIIPARYQSSRFPGKPLSLIAGKSLLQRTWENSQSSSLFHELLVATDDERIYDHVIHFGGKAVITPKECRTGSHRAAAVVAADPSLSSYEIVVNIQGDEPCINPLAFAGLCEALQQDSQAMVATAVSPLDSPEEAENRNIMKCVLGLKQQVLYFSRALIPAGHATGFQKGVCYFRHVGIYAFRRDFLLHYAQLPITALQLAEDHELLPVLEHGYRVKAVLIEEIAIGVDTPQDISKIEKILLCKQNSSLSQVVSVPHSEKG